jgi:hypothetical protein
MTNFKLLGSVALLSIVVAAPAFARSHHHRHHRHHATASDFYIPNFGPGVRPGEPFAYYDGPLSVRCKQSAAAYLGQDGRRHPCN